MARKKGLSGFYEKRKILFGQKATPAKLRAQGMKFMDAGRHDDALEAFDRAGADDLARQIAAMAMDAGNTPLYMRAKKVLREKIGEEEWLELAAKAEQAGMYSAAHLAFRLAGREGDAERTRLLMLPTEARGSLPEGAVDSDSPEGDVGT